MAAPTEEFDVSSYVLHHIVDSQQWHIPFLPPIDIPRPLSLHAVMIGMAGFFLVLLFGVFYNRNRREKRIPTGLTNLLEVFVLYVRDEICVPSLGKKDGRAMTPVFCTLFFMILGMNLMGLIPLFSTATANLGVTLGFSTITLAFMIIGGLIKNGPIKFVKSFVPAGVPIPLNIFIWCIEFLGMFIRAFALMIRLCCNMVAGHIVLLSLIGTVVVMGAKGLPMMLLVLFIYLLELLVAFLQAYIFTMFSALFIGLIYHPEH